MSSRWANAWTLFSGFSHVEPRFDDVTGEALNVAALELQRRATQNDYVAAHAPSEDSPLRRVPAVDVAPGRHKYVLTQLAIGDEAAPVVRAYAGLRKPRIEQFRRN